jgi:hypothetical protein
MTAAVVIGTQCQYCSKFRPPGDVLTWPGGVRICLHCYEWHKKALDLMATGGVPDGCQACCRTFEQLDALYADAAGNTPMYFHSKDGIYQILCPQCSEAYEQKRRDLYGATVYGKLKGIG